MISMEKDKFKCCFCGDTICSNKIDVTGLIVISNWDKAANKQQEQQLFCHIKCLKESIKSDVHLYISDLNL